MSQRSEDDAERTACLAISKHLHLCKQGFIVAGVDTGQLRCTVLLKKGTDLSRKALTGLVCENGSDLFQGQCGFGGSVGFGCTPVWGSPLNISARVFATSLTVAAAVRRSLIASSSSLNLPIYVAFFLDLLVFHGSVDFLCQVCCDDDEVEEDINQFLFGGHHLSFGLVHSVHLPEGAVSVLLLTPPNGNGRCVLAEKQKSFLEKFREFFLQDAHCLFEAVGEGLARDTDLPGNGGIT